MLVFDERTPQRTGRCRLARWGRLSPGNDESAGKRRSDKTGQGNPWLREILTARAGTSSPLAPFGEAPGPR